MTPFWAFIVGMFFSGIMLSLLFGSFCLDAEEEAYWQGYYDGRNSKDCLEVNEVDFE